MSARKFIDDLLAAQSGTPAIARHDTRGPVLPLYSLDYRNLPVKQEIKNLMKDIMSAGGPYDKGKASSIGDDTFGAMRQIHSNEPAYLPRLGTPSGLSGRAAAIDNYAKSHKRHSSDRGGGNKTTGYVEYTAGTNELYTWGGNRFRIVFDYVNSRLFFTPFHYASWDLSRAGEIDLIDKPPGGSGWHNPFFWITEL